MFISITDFQKHVTVSISLFNNVLLNKSRGILQQYKLPYYKYNNLNNLKKVNYEQLLV